MNRDEIGLLLEQQLDVMRADRARLETSNRLAMPTATSRSVS
jgi:hypothetical protein